MQFFRWRRQAMHGALALGLALGAFGAVAATPADVARAQVNDTELDGTVEQMPADGLVGIWQVGGRTIQVTETTVIDQEMGPLALGVSVEVEGTAQTDGSILASEIEVEDNR